MRGRRLDASRAPAKRHDAGRGTIAREPCPLVRAVAKQRESRSASSASIRSGSFANLRGRLPPAHPRWIDEAKRPQKPRRIAATILGSRSREGDRRDGLARDAAPHLNMRALPGTIALHGAVDDGPQAERDGHLTQLRDRVHRPERSEDCESLPTQQPHDLGAHGFIDIVSSEGKHGDLTLRVRPGLLGHVLQPRLIGRHRAHHARSAESGPAPQSARAGRGTAAITAPTAMRRAALGTINDAVDPLRMAGRSYTKRGDLAARSSSSHARASRAGALVRGDAADPSSKFLLISYGRDGRDRAIRSQLDYWLAVSVTSSKTESCAGTLAP